MLRFATFLAPSVLPVYQFIADTVGQRLGVETELVVGDSHDQYADLHPDIAFICGLPYVLMTQQNPPLVKPLVAPVLLGDRYQNKPIYFSDVIVRADSPHQSFADLRGGSWAYNEVVSQSGYGITRHHLLQMGETHGFFSQVVNAGWHQRAIQMIVASEVDGAAIDSQVLSLELRNHPELSAQIKIIDTFGPSTIQPVVVRADLPDSIQNAVRQVLLSLSDNPADRAVLAEGLFQRFVPIADADYDDIRLMLHAAESAHFLTIA